MPKSRKPPAVQFIAPDSYPQMLSKPRAARALHTLRTPETAAKAQAGNPTPSFNFREVAAGSDDKDHVAEGYDADVLIRWGDTTS